MDKCDTYDFSHPPLLDQCQPANSFNPNANTPNSSEEAKRLLSQTSTEIKYQHQFTYDELNNLLMAVIIGRDLVSEKRKSQMYELQKTIMQMIAEG